VEAEAGIGKILKEAEAI